MKSLVRLMFIALLMLLYSASFADVVITNPAPNTVTTVITTKDPAVDDSIVSSIYGRFSKNAALIGTRITATSANGIVTLSGTVTAQSQADAAINDAKAIPGVKDVRSQINVTTNPQLGPTPTQAAPNY